MHSIEYSEVNPLDADEVDAWLALLQACDRHDLPDLPITNATQAIMGLIRQTTNARQLELIGKDGGQVVSAARVHMPLRDNTRQAEVELLVHPQRRRHGVGTGMLREVEARLREFGRDIVHMYVVAHDGVAYPRGEAGERFAQAHDFVFALQEDQRALDLHQVDDDQMSTMLADAWGKAEGYELVTWVNAVPDDLVDELAYLAGRLMDDSPTGALSLESENYDSSRIRVSEHHNQLIASVKFGAGVRHMASGRLAGFTEVFVNAPQEHDAWQGATIVDRDFRGHRIGTILKIENLRHLRAYRPSVRHVRTWNAAGNSHMIAINEALDFRLMASWVAYEKKLG